MLTSLASALMKISLFEYFQASFGTLYGQLDIPWFPSEPINPATPPILSSYPIVQSFNSVVYHRAYLLFVEIQLVFPFAFPAR